MSAPHTSLSTNCVFFTRLSPIPGNGGVNLLLEMTHAHALCCPTVWQPDCNYILIVLVRMARHACTRWPGIMTCRITCPHNKLSIDCKQALNTPRYICENSYDRFHVDRTWVWLTKELVDVTGMDIIIERSYYTTDRVMQNHERFFCTTMSAKFHKRFSAVTYLWSWDFIGIFLRGKAIREQVKNLSREIGSNADRENDLHSDFMYASDHAHSVTLLRICFRLQYSVQSYVPTKCQKMPFSRVSYWYDRWLVQWPIWNNTCFFGAFAFFFRNIRLAEWYVIKKSLSEWYRESWYFQIFGGLFVLLQDICVLNYAFEWHLHSSLIFVGPDRWFFLQKK